MISGSELGTGVDETYFGVEDHIYTMFLWIPPTKGFSQAGLTNHSAV